MKHDAVSKSLLKEGMLAYNMTAAITACIIIIDTAIPLTRAKRLAAMRESDERIISIFHILPAKPPAFYVYALVYDLGGYRIALLLLSSLVQHNSKNEASF